MPSELMRELVVYFKRFTGCEAVGVCLRQGNDVPYYETTGFPESLLKMENFQQQAITGEDRPDWGFPDEAFVWLPCP